MSHYWFLSCLWNKRHKLKIIETRCLKTIKLLHLINIHLKFKLQDSDTGRVWRARKAIIIITEGQKNKSIVYHLNNLFYVVYFIPEFFLWSNPWKNGKLFLRFDFSVKPSIPLAANSSPVSSSQKTPVTIQSTRKTLTEASKSKFRLASAVWRKLSLNVFFFF